MATSERKVFFCCKQPRIQNRQRIPLFEDELQHISYQSFFRSWICEILDSFLQKSRITSDCRQLELSDYFYNSSKDILRDMTSLRRSCYFAVEIGIVSLFTQAYHLQVLYNLKHRRYFCSRYQLISDDIIYVRCCKYFMPNFYTEIETQII